MWEQNQHRGALLLVLTFGYQAVISADHLLINRVPRSPPDVVGLLRTSPIADHRECRRRILVTRLLPRYVGCQPNQIIVSPCRSRKPSRGLAKLLTSARFRGTSASKLDAAFVAALWV
jgi:hypothetical protein